MNQTIWMRPGSFTVRLLVVMTKWLYVIVVNNGYMLLLLTMAGVDIVRCIIEGILVIQI